MAKIAFLEKSSLSSGEFLDRSIAPVSRPVAELYQARS